MLILDTDHLTLFLQGQFSIVQRFTTIDPTEIAITIVTAEEQIRGRLSAVRRSTQSLDREKLIRAYSNLHQTLDDLVNFQILDFTEAADVQYQLLRRQKIRVSTQDLRIAAIALALNGTVVTRNRQDFGQVPGLKLADWTV